MILTKLISVIKSVFKVPKYPTSCAQDVDQERGILCPIQEDIKAENEGKKINTLYSEYKGVLLKAIELGRSGKLVVSPENILLAGTNNCNLRCIMCYVEKWDTNIYNITSDEVNQLLLTKEHDCVSYGQVKNIDLTSGESLLNPDIHLIVKRLKSLYPNAEISIITNGTLKVQRNIAEALQYIDRIGISLDGASQDTFEYIRHGANFFRVIRNIQDIVKLKEHDKEKLSLLFCAMTINAHELPAWVKLAYYLDIKYLFVQKMEVRSGVKYDIEKYALSNLPNEEIQLILDETKKEVANLDRYMTLTDLFQTDIKEQNKLDLDNSNMLDLDNSMRMCKTIWNTSPWLHKDERGYYPEVVCCHMPHSQYSTLADKSHLRNTSLTEIFNSTEYWDMRSDILSGELAKTACAGCQYYKMTTWTEEELMELASIIKNL